MVRVYFQSILAAAKIAFAKFLCILSPICLLVLGAAAGGGYIPFSDEVAGGVGVIILLLMIAGAVAIFISCGMELSPYEYLEKEVIETEYGVNGMVKGRKEQFKEKYTRYNILGVCLCILAAVPIFVGVFFEENDLLMVLMIAILLVMVAIGVRFFILAGIPWGSMQKLLQEGEYTVEAKQRNKKIGWVAPVYWLIATAIYLAYSFATNDWGRSWIVWPVAGVLFAAVAVVCDMIAKSGK